MRYYHKSDAWIVGQYTLLNRKNVIKASQKKSFKTCFKYLSANTWFPSVSER